MMQRQSTGYTSQHRTGWIALAIAGGFVLLVPVIGVLVWLWLQWGTLEANYPYVADTLRIAIFLLPITLGTYGTGALITALWRRYGWRESIFADKQAAMMRSKVQVAPLATSFTFSPRNSEEIAATPDPLSLPDSGIPASLPGAIDLASLGVHPSPDSILLAVDENGPITVAVADLCHVALLGSTGGGKSNLLRLIVPQLQAIGASVILADPHYAPFDPENGDDWRPIAGRLAMAPAVKASEIDQVLDYMTEELKRRLEKRRRGEKVGSPLFLAFDELPVICELVSDAPAKLGKLLREGRKVHMLTIGASQSMLIKEIGGSSSLRDQYRTCFYVGGDKKSASAILDLPERDIDDGPLGKGVVLLRSKATQPPCLVRVPLVSNDALIAMLGGASHAPTAPLPFGFRPATKAPPVEGALEGALEGASVAAPSTAPGSTETTTAEAARALALIQAGKSLSEVIKELFGVTSGRVYQEKAVWLMEVIRAALKER